MTTTIAALHVFTLGIQSPEPAMVFVLDRVPTLSERNRLVASKGAGLLPLPISDLPSFRFYVQPSLIDHPDIQLAEDALVVLRKRNVAGELKLSDLPPACQKKALAVLNRFVDRNQSPLISPKTSFKIAMKAWVPFSTPQGQNELAIEVHAKESQPPASPPNGVEAPLEIATTQSEPKTRDALVIWSSQGMNERQYWKLLGRITAQLTEIRSNKEAAYRKHLNEATKEWFGSSLDDLLRRAPQSPSEATGPWAEKWNGFVRRQEALDHRFEPPARFGPAGGNLMIQFSFGNVNLNYSLPALFEGD